MQNTRAVCRVCACLFLVNLILFASKLYIGLASNSISIFSDSVNNLFDSLSVLLTFSVLTVMLKTADKKTVSMAENGEQLFSFLISVIIVLTGFYFAYSSLERFMYPTPVWYTSLYLWVLIISAFIKLIMFVFLRLAYKRLSSEVLKIISVDSLLDFFITFASVLTLLLSSAEHFSFDALFGLLISAAIIVPGIRLLLSSGASLINFVPTVKRESVNEIIDKNGLSERLFYIKYLRTGNKTEGYAFFSSLDFETEELAGSVYSKTGINLYCILKNNDTGEGYD